MSIVPSSVTDNGILGAFTLSGSIVTVIVSDTSLLWRIRGTKDGNDYDKFYIKQSNLATDSFYAYDGYSYTFQVCSPSGQWSDGTIFTVYYDLNEDMEESNVRNMRSVASGNVRAGHGAGAIWSQSKYFGEACEISWTPLTEYTTYKVEFSIGSYSVITDPYTPGTTERIYYYHFIIPFEAAREIPNDTSGLMAATIIPYSDSACTVEMNSRATTYFEVTLKDEDALPTMNTVKLSKDNSVNPLLNTWDVALSGFTKIKIEGTASGAYGSTIKSYVISGQYGEIVEAVGANLVLNYSTPIIRFGGIYEFSVYCVDSRGHTSKPIYSDKISVALYEPPKIQGLIVARKPTTNNLAVLADWTTTKFMTKVGDNVFEEVNHGTCQLYYRTTSNLDWTLHNGKLSAGEEFELTEVTLSPDRYESYHIKIVVTDEIGRSDTRERYYSTTKVLLDFKADGDGLGIGKVCESPGMEVYMDSLFLGDVYIGGKTQTLKDYIISVSPTLDMIYPVGSIYMSVNGNDPGMLFGGVWTRIQGRFLIGVGAPMPNSVNTFGSLSGNAYIIEAGDSGGEDLHRLNANEIPEHNHGLYARVNLPVPTYDTNEKIYPMYYTEEFVGSPHNYLISKNKGGEYHNNMPPYFAVYIWQRIK